MKTGKVSREVKVPTHPHDLIVALSNPDCLERVGLESGPLSQWLFSGMVASGLPVVCIETRHAKAFLKAQINKNDRNDARGIAQMMRVNLFRGARQDDRQPAATRFAYGAQPAAGQGSRDRK